MTMVTDVLVIGRSIAGSTLNYLLKDSGLKSMVVDKSVFPRSKACGEGLSSLVLDLYRKEGIEIDLKSLRHVEYKNYIIHCDSTKLTLGHKRERGLGVERQLLDPYLASLSNPNSQFVTAKVENLKFENDHWIVAGKDFKISAKFIVFADGSVSPCTKILGIERSLPTKERYGLSSWWESAKEHHIKNVEIICDDRFQLYITPLTKTKINATVLGSSQIIKEFRAQPQKFANEISNYSPLTFTQRGEVLGAGPFGTRLKKVCTENYLAIGDAAETFDPCSGLGMYHATYSAQLAFRMIDQYFDKRSELALRYNLLLNNHNKNLRRYDYFIVFIMENINSSRILKFISNLGVAKLLDKFLTTQLRKNLFESLKKLNNQNSHTQVAPGSFRYLPAAYGLLTLLLFGLAVVLMNFRIYFGLDRNLFEFHLQHPLILDLLLLLQFPLFHSLLLGPSRKFLFFWSQNQTLKKLSTTTYVFIASIQLLIVFLFWQFIGPTYLEPTGQLYWLFSLAFIFSNFYLAKAMYDAGLGVQLGYAGWIAAATNSKVKYPEMPQKGSFKYCRQPIYLAFFLILWLSPFWTFDKIFLALPWSLYCIFGPLLKEKRFGKIYGDKFNLYKKRVSYFIPSLNGLSK